MHSQAKPKKTLGMGFYYVKSMPLATNNKTYRRSTVEG